MGLLWRVTTRSRTGGTGRVVDLSQELYVSAERRNYKTLPKAEQPGPTGAPSSSGASRCHFVSIGQGPPGGPLCQVFKEAA